MQPNAADSDQSLPHAVSSARVLAEEYALIWPNRPQPQGADDEAVAADYYVKAFANKQAALCLSGGGIRSAAFALGVIQALSRKRILTGFHYLSTVSGGGYIGAWLQRWIAEPGKNATAVMDELGRHAEAGQVSALREEANFITPRAGIGSNDTWTALAISVRNIAINWLLFGPLFLLIVLVPNLFASGLDRFPRDMIQPGPYQLYYGEVVLTGLLTAFACLHFGRGLPSYGSDRARDGRAAEAWVRWRIVLPLVMAAGLGSFVLACDLFWQPHLYWQGTLLAVAIAAGMMIGLVAGGFRLGGPGRRILVRDLPFWLAAAIGAAATIQLGALILAANLSAPLIEPAPPPATAAAAQHASTPPVALPGATPPASGHEPAARRARQGDERQQRIWRRRARPRARESGTSPCSPCWGRSSCSGPKFRPFPFSPHSAPAAARAFSPTPTANGSRG